MTTADQSLLDTPLLAGSRESLRRFPVGTTSADHTVLVGRDGWLFLICDSNDFMRQYCGRLPLSSSALGAWEALIAHQESEASTLGIGLAGVVIPEKLSVYATHFPARLEPGARRPAQTLSGRLGHVIRYPVAALLDAASAADVFLRTDPHVSPAGAAVVYADTMAQFGLAVPDGLDRLDLHASTVCGDLGRLFDPPLHEVARVPAASPMIEYVDLDASGMGAAGHHIGLRRLTRNPAAPHDVTLLIFGGSSTAPPAAPGTLGDLLSRTFTEVQFLWAPFAWDSGLVRDVSPDLILLQTTERYVNAVPQFT